ncbi:MAG: cation transporter [Candidatus Latescibacteria bacterium]|nr:cation transporter [Candidatus Latescibacterota bacterium]
MSQEHHRDRAESNAMNQDTRQIRRITWTGLLINVFLSALKFVVGFLGSSQAVLADAVHSLSDMSTDVAVLFGVKYWSAPPDEEHPYGHRRIEAVITSAIGLLLASVAVGIGYKALTTMRAAHPGQTGWVALTGPLVSIILKELLYHWTVAIGTRAKSPAVIANAWHHRSDALSSLPALIAVAVSAWNPEWAFVDHVGAIMVSLFILKVAWDIISPSVSELIDCGATENDRERIERIAHGVGGVRDVHTIRTRKFGVHFHVDLHLLVAPDMSVRQGHTISEDVKQALMESEPTILDVVVHLEPDERMG